MGLGETIDIPESGAVFTLGKSYLSENHQSYFFIKNDAIRRLICGRNQSAVVCESGRLFVWGENQFGQLGIGTSDIVTKPSCVKTIKALGERVRNVAFGEAFAVILTESSKLFYSGRTTFEGETATAALREHFGSVSSPGDGDDAAQVVPACRKPFELSDFGAVLLDAEGNVGGGEHIVDVAAGDEHFVALTGSGKIYGWGSNAFGQLGGTGSRGRPTLLSDAEEPVRVVSCGRKCTAFITANNAVYILGTTGELQFTVPVPINTSSLEDLMYSIYWSHDDDQIYLVISSGEIFRSVEHDGQLHFEPHNVISENIRKICTGVGFVAIVTESNKLLTTFREKSSASEPGSGGGRLRSPREMRKFQKLEVVDAVCGAQHILVHGVQSSIAANALLSSSSNDEADMMSVTETDVMNDLNRSKSNANIKAGDEEAGDSLIQTLRRCLTMKDSRNILSSKIPVFDSRRLSQENKIPESAMELAEPTNIPIEKSTSLNEIEKLELEEESVGEKRAVEVASKRSNITSGSSKKPSPVPTSAGSMRSIAQTVIHRTPANHEDFNNNSNGLGPESGRQRSRHSTEENTSLSDEQREVALQNEMLGIEDELPPDGMSSGQSNEIMFIDNGVEVELVSPSTVAPEGESADQPEVDESSTMYKNDTIEFTLLGEKLTGADDVISLISIKEETKNAVRQAVGEDIPPVTSTSAVRKSTPRQSKSGTIETADDDSERTTASFTSERSPTNPFGNDDHQTAVGDTSTENDLVAVENGRMKRFIRDMRTKGRGMSCRHADAVAVEEDVDAAKTTVEQVEADGHAAVDKTSKVCIIL